MENKIKKNKTKFEVLSFLDKVKNLFIVCISLIVIIFSIFYVIKSTVNHKILISPFPVPKILIDLGYSDLIASQMYLDEINYVSTTATSLYARKEYCVYEKEGDINIPFLEKEVSLGTATFFLQKVFGITSNTISGNLILSGQDSIIFSSRYNSNLPVIVSGKITDLKNIFRKSVEEQFKYFDPFMLASYFESQDNDRKCVETVIYIIGKASPTEERWAYNLWGEILMKYRFLEEEAKNKFKQSLSVDSTFFLPYYNLGQLAYLDSNYNEALKYYQRSLKLSNKFEKAYIGLATTFLAKKDFLNADKNIETVIRINSKNGNAYRVKAKLYLAKKDTSNAINFIDKAIALDNNVAEYYEALAEIKQSQKEDQSAEQLYRKAYFLDKSSLRLANLLQKSMIINGDTAAANDMKKEINRLEMYNYIKSLSIYLTKQSLLH